MRDAIADPRAAIRALTRFLLAATIAIHGAASAAEPERSTQSGVGEGSLVVHGTIDRPAFDPLLAAFRARHPEIRVRYEDLNSIRLQEGFLRAVAAGEPTADLVMSSAIDLQTKLVNDGHARAYLTPNASALPGWAVWRNEAYAYSFDPVVIVYNRRALDSGSRPSNRYRLIELLNADPDRFAGRVGTYDPVTSGTGYLYLTQDIEQSPVVWQLLGALSQVGVRLFSTSRAIIDRVASGELLIGYNVVGTYALARARTDSALGVVLPEDYTLVVARTAFISRHGRRPDLARVLLDFLLSREGQATLARESDLLPVRSDVESRFSIAELARATFGGARMVRMSPGLLVYVDPLKREKVLQRWRAAIEAGAPHP